MEKSQAAPVDSWVASRYPAGGPGRHLKARLRAGKVLVGGIVSEYLRPSLMKIYRHAGYDFVFADYEHAFFDPLALTDTVQSARDNGLPMIAKTPQLERQEVAKLLECGVVGIQLPRTDSREQLETLRSYMKFPPAGTRAAALVLGNTDYTVPSDLASAMADADAETTIVVHIETKVGYQNAEEIVSTPGVDMVYLGAGDFSIEMGHPGDYEHPGVVGPMEEILALCRKHNVPFGTSAPSIEAARRWIEKGALFFEAGDELGFIRQGASQLIQQYRQLIR